MRPTQIHSTSDLLDYGAEGAHHSKRRLSQVHPRTPASPSVSVGSAGNTLTFCLVPAGRSKARKANTRLGSLRAVGGSSVPLPRDHHRVVAEPRATFPELINSRVQLREQILEGLLIARKN